MDIRAIDIKQYHATADVVVTEDGLFHKKSLPVLSVVQSVEGSYAIGIDTEQQVQTGDMGAFIAPPEKLQYITHCVDSVTKVMRAQWIFMDVIINGYYNINDLFEFPVILPRQYQKNVYEIIKSVAINSNICDNLSDIYQLVKILVEISKPKTAKSAAELLKNEIESYIYNHCSEKITANQIAAQFSLSVPNVFRKFRLFFNKSPANFINDVRLTRAAFILETTDMPMSEICRTIGFEDSFYFSKLYKIKYNVSPSIYRQQIKMSLK